MLKITNERLEQLQKRLRGIEPAVKEAENGIDLINAITLDCTDYELACFIIYKFLEIDSKVKDYNCSQNRKERAKKEYKIKFLNKLSNTLIEEQLKLFRITIPCRLISGEYEVNNDYVEVFGICINYKENAELKFKLENKLPNKKEIINKGKI